MSHHPPVLKYCGLTIILSHAGRFDKDKAGNTRLISGFYAREVEDALKPVSRFSCDIRDAGCTAALLPNTRVVLLCGANLLTKYFGEQPGRLSQLRGSPKTIGGITYIPTYHTTDAYDRQEYETRLNSTLQGATEEGDESDEPESDHNTKNKGRTSRANYGFWLRADIQKAVRIAKSGLNSNTCHYNLRLPIQIVLEGIHSAKFQRVFFDIETLPGSCQMSCFALSTDAASVLSVSLINYRGELSYGQAGTREILRELARLFTTATVVIHNAQFDLFILGWKYKICPPAYDRIEDTMLMHARNYIGLEKSLGHCVGLYTDQPYHKDEGVFNPKTFDQETALLTYNAKDVETLALVYEGIIAHGKKLGTLDSQQQANRTLRAYLGCSFRGIKLDNPNLCAHLDSLDIRRDFFEQRVLTKLCGFNLNPRSHQQVSKYLYEMLKLPRPKGNVSPTGKTTLYKLAIAHQLPAIKVILCLRRISKDCGTLRFTQWNGRATCCYKIAGTKSGRLASTALLDRWGTNLQNINKDRCRQFFVADDDNILLQVDQSGAEALIVTMMTAPGSNLRQLAAAGIKAHTYFAMHLFADVWQNMLFKGTDSHIEAFLQCPIAQLKTLTRWPLLAQAIADSDSNEPSKRYYHHAKMGVHGCNYSIAGPKFVMQVLEKSDGEIVLLVNEGNRIVKTFHVVFPEIQRDFQATVRAQLNSTGTLHNFFGHPRVFYHYGRPIDEILVREAFSYIPQSTVGLITSYCVEELQAGLDSGAYSGFEILTNTHDSVLLQCRPDAVDEVDQLTRKHMNRKLLSPYGEEFFMKSDSTRGYNWKDLKKV